jgi:endonuclease YncB( thermonuclease family)
MARRKINEKMVGLGLVAIGLMGFIVGWQSQVKQHHFISSAQHTMSRAVRPLQATKNMSFFYHPDTLQACRVLTVYDGDTLGCDLNKNGQIERPAEEIRLLGIDTPERSYSRKNPSYLSAHPTDEPYAKQASDWMTRQTDHKTVYLQYDLRRSDRYGRTLAFVYTSPKAQDSLNLQAIRFGYARMLFLGKNRMYEDKFILAETQARQAKRGIWDL